MASNMTDSTNKRSFAEFAAGSEHTLTVLTADGGRIPAHNEVTRGPKRLLRSGLAPAVLPVAVSAGTKHAVLAAAVPAELYCTVC
jgi:hypothetical protein